MSTRQLVYVQEDFLRDDEGTTPHIVEGRRLHGGFSDGVYQPPRSRLRSSALREWREALLERGGRPLVADSSLLTGTRIPNAEQLTVLVANGLDRILWNSLTIIGKIEARGRLLAEMNFPDLQPSIVEDISSMAIGHLNKGLLVAHGLDEGGQPSEGIGGHDEMWFLARDLAFGVDAYPDAEPPADIGRPAEETILTSDLAPDVASMVSLLANLLIIEFRAELGFADTQSVLRNPRLFTDRRADAERASEIVERIRTDELIHVESLCLYLGELRSITFRTVDGSTESGADYIDPLWVDLVRWATIEQPRQTSDRQREMIVGMISTLDDATRVLSEFDAAG